MEKIVNPIDINIDEYMSLLMNLEIKLFADNYLKSKNINNEKISLTNVFLISFYIYNFRSELNIDYLDIIYLSSSNIYNKYIKNTITEYDMNLHNNKYLEWQSYDKKKTFLILMKQYFDIYKCLLRIDNDILYENDKKILIENLNKINLKSHSEFNNFIKFEKFKKLNIEKYINNENIFDNKDIDNINEILFQIHLYNMNGFDYLGSDISIIMKRAYWDNMCDLYKNINYDDYNKIFTDSIKNIKDLIYSIHNIELYENLFDIELLSSQIKHNTINYLKLVSDIVNVIIPLDSKNGEKELMVWKDKILYLENYDIDINLYIPYILRDLINKLENIKYIVDNIRSFKNE